MMKKKRWPAELRQPILKSELVPVPPGMLGELFEKQEDLSRRRMEARLNKIGRIAECLGLDRPGSDTGGWAWLVIALCERFGIASFEVAAEKPRGPGTSKRWTERAHFELFADVQELRHRISLSELAACKRLASNSKKYGERYRIPKRSSVAAWGSTLHRQFLHAKQFIPTAIAPKMMTRDLEELVIKRFAYLRQEGYG